MQHLARPRLLPSPKHPHRCLDRLLRPLSGELPSEASGKVLLPQHLGQQPRHLGRLRPHLASLAQERRLASMPRQQLPSEQLQRLPSLLAALLPREQQVRLCSASPCPRLGLAQMQARHLVEAVRAGLFAKYSIRVGASVQLIPYCAACRIVWCKQACLRCGHAGIWSRSYSVCGKLAIPFRDAGTATGWRRCWI